VSVWIVRTKGPFISANIEPKNILSRVSLKKLELLRKLLHFRETEHKINKYCNITEPSEQCD